MPADCVSTGSCTLLVTYKTNGGKLDFAISASNMPSGSFAALAFSDDGKMGNDLVLACVDGSSMLTTWNLPQKSNIPGVEGISLESLGTEIEDGFKTCTFTLNEQITAAPPDQSPVQFDLINSRQFLLLAAGSMSASGELLTYHSQNKLASAGSVALKSVEPVGSATTVLIRVHGVLMIIAWMASASCGMMLARYFKETWKGSQNCFDKDRWFVLHVSLMVVTLVCTLVGGTIIFSDRGFDPFRAAFLKEYQHPVVGAICIIFMIIQPIMAFFRPHPNEPSRPIFNWAHWFVGNAAYGFGLIAILMAGELPAASFLPSDSWSLLILIFIGVHVLNHLVLIVQRAWAKNATAVEAGCDGCEDVFNGKNDTKRNDLKGSDCRVGAVIIYVFFYWVYSVVMIALIISATEGKEGFFDCESSSAEAEAEAEAE
ncbi:hypothetical protein TCAL_11262 [Tigriopus californicus]|uniref:Cytochrome b561 domain-containing protein n=2 Tax=Tigriopus californicus TaxID=6832 RepID=A0A553P3M2_TIGCA|nr:hypothetical protein TCAL_11262 [Tigriopus californicus]|eukprot:TCALIF_11262-PA protein Name:"Similar to CG8399 Putative ferric-chelate reductase 1 homolog (Drosophila melanogaster)" AED:0.03 eAED:0.03 QI:0/-1/0/1/-1/1/1/0/428